jgi:hypothetical protein
MLFNKKAILSFFVVLLFCFTIRLWFVIAYPQEGSDAGKYLQLASSIRTHHVFSYDGVMPTDSRAPFYPFLISCVQVFSESLSAIRIAQVLIDTLNCALFIFLAYQLFKSYQVAFLTGTIYTLSPELIGSTSFILSETATTFLLGLTLTCMIRSDTKSKSIFWFISGLCLGLATLCRPITLLYPFFLIMYAFPFCRNERKIMGGLIVMFLGFVLIICPWTIRNYIVFDTFIPISSNAGGNLFIASNQTWFGTYNEEMLLIRSEIEKEIGTAEKGHFAVDNELKRRALQTIKNDFGGYLRLCLKRIFELWLGIPGSKEILKSYLWAKIFFFVFHLSVLVLGSYGFISLFRWKHVPLRYMLPFSFIVYFTIFHTALVALPRYRIPIFPMVILYAAYGFVVAAGHIRERKASKTSEAL